jgi:hypothetical protein
MKLSWSVSKFTLRAQKSTKDFSQVAGVTGEIRNAYVLNSRVDSIFGHHVRLELSRATPS